MFTYKKEAYAIVVENLDKRITENLDCLEFLVTQLKEEEEVVKFYVRKRNAIVRQMINEVIDTKHMEL